MLQALRSHAGSWIVKILFALLIVSFGIWGIGDIFRGRGPSTVVAEVGGTKIETPQLDQEFRDQVNRLRQMFGGQFGTAQAKAMGLLDQTLQQMIGRTLYDLAARDAGLRVDDSLVAHEIGLQKAFQNPKGQFDRNRFAQVLQANNLTEAGYVALLRSGLARQQVVGAVEAGGYTPQTLATALFAYRDEARTADTLLLPNASITAVPTPTDADIAQYYKDKATRFMAPEYRALTVGILSINDVAAGIKVSDADLKKAYADRADEFRTPERRDLLQVVVPDQKVAAAIAAAAQKSGDLAAAAKANGATAQSLTGVAKKDIPLAAVADAAFALKQGAVSQPVKSELGWHVLEVGKVTPASEQSFDQAKPKLLADLQHSRARNQIYDLSNKLDDLFAGGGTLEEAAQKMGLKLTTIAAVDATGKQPDGKDVQLADLKQIMGVAFQTAQGQVSELTETPEGNDFIVRVNKVTPPAERPLASVRDQVIADWKADKQAQEAAAKADQMAAALSRGTSLADVAKAFGATQGTVGPLTRDAKDTGALTPELVTKLFAMKPGDVAHGPSGASQVVFRLAKIIPADPAKAQDKLKTLRQAVTTQIGSDLAAQFQDSLRQRYPVTIHRGVLDAMYPAQN